MKLYMTLLTNDKNDEDFITTYTTTIIEDNNIVSQGIDEKGIEGYLSSDLNSLDNKKQWRVFGKYNNHYFINVYNLSIFFPIKLWFVL